MSTIQNEMDAIQDRIRNGAHPLEQSALFAAQQALAWAINPMAAQSPLTFILGIREGLEDCSEETRPPQL